MAGKRKTRPVATLGNLSAPTPPPGAHHHPIRLKARPARAWPSDRKATSRCNFRAARPSRGRRPWPGSPKPTTSRSGFPWTRSIPSTGKRSLREPNARQNSLSLPASLAATRDSRIVSLRHASNQGAQALENPSCPGPSCCAEGPRYAPTQESAWLDLPVRPAGSQAS